MSTKCVVRRWLLVVAMALMAPLAVLTTASSAVAANPYEKYFSQCPTSYPGIELCLYGEIRSGEFAIGSTKVPIEKKIVQQAGVVPSGLPRTDYLVPPKNGESLSKTEEKRSRWVARPD